MTADAPTPANEPRAALGVVVALALAGVLLVAGAVVAWLGTSADSDADHEQAAASQRVNVARGALGRAQADLAAARAAVATFEESARGATAASAHVVELESALVDRLSRLREAGDAEDIGTYNRLVSELNASSDELVTAFTDLEAPLKDFSSALDALPTARCTGPVAETVKWTEYGGNGLGCARLRVPLDYAEPRAAQIEISVVRRPADDAATSLGPLVLNPGGPGLSGISFMRDAILLMPPELLRRFDLIAFDPRGVGHSTPVDCADNLDPLFDPDLTAPVASTRNDAVKGIERIVRGCAARTGRLLRHVDTISAARDMDRLRNALGVDQLSYLGFSYGTYLGAVYADLFPSRVRAAVLDGAVDPRRATRESAITNPVDFDTALRAALDDCAANPRCAFFSAGDPSAAYDNLMTRLAKEPLDVAGHRIGRSLAELSVVSGLYQGVAGWPKLMNALARAAAGNGQLLSELSDRYTGRRADGSYNNEFEAHYAINCIDLNARLDVPQARSMVHNLGSDPGRFETVSLALALPCTFWPALAHDPPGALDAKGAAPILVIGGEHDPVTPIEGAEALAGALDSATLLRWQGTGHTAFLRGTACVDDAVVSYLIDLKVPPANTSCPAR